MVAITDIRVAIAAQLDTIPGLRATATAPLQISPPVAIVRPDRGTFATYGETFDGAVSFTFEVFLLVSAASDREAQQQLDAYLAATGTQSVFACLQKTSNLGGLVSYAALTSAQSYGLVDYGGVTYLGAILTVQAGAP